MTLPVMSTPAVIDYASPASRASLRLPAKSDIRWEYHPGGRELRIVQTLAGKLEAVGALGLAAITFVVMSTYPFWNGRILGFWYLCVYLLAATAVWLLSQPMEMRGTFLGG